MNNSDDLSRLIEQQNRLLDRQNKLLQQLVEQKNSVPDNALLDGEKIFVEDLWRDEVRNGFFVTSRRKRLWNIQLNLIAELDRICKRYDIRYFAFGGTLLGAARHKGFVPWDDDVDISMLRPDYEKFKQVIAKEIREPYFVDAWHDYQIEGEEKISAPSLQIVKQNQRQQHPKWWPFWPMIKIKDSRTAFIRYPDRPHVHQGIWIDIFPFDPVPPFADNKHAINFEIAKEMLHAIALPGSIRKTLQENLPLLIKREVMEKFLKYSHRQKAHAFDSFALKSFSPSPFVGQLRGHTLVKHKLSYALKNFAKTVYLPFEKIKIPAPIGYEDCLTAQYGDWHKIKIYDAHATDYSANLSYKDYFREVGIRDKG